MAGIQKQMLCSVTMIWGFISCFFAVWAPRAKGVSVVGDFNGWDPEANVMQCDNDMGIYQLFIPGIKEGALYKYCITTYNDKLLYKADPYGNYAELRPGNASRVADLAKPYRWGDSAWLTKRQEFDPAKDAMSIYEVHPGSWKKHPAQGEDDPGFYNYSLILRKMPCRFTRCIQVPGRNILHREKMIRASIITESLPMHWQVM